MSSITEPQSRWARLVSDVFSPPIVWAFLIFPIAFRTANGSSEAMIWASVYALFICFLPIGYLAWLLRSGRITDMHLKERRQRFVPLMVMLTLNVIGYAIMLVLKAPSALPVLALITLIEMIIITLITFVWQISIHTMSITSATIAIGFIFGIGYAYFGIPLIMLVSAARMKLQRHTSAQVVAGTLVGGLVPVIVLMMLF